MELKELDRFLRQVMPREQYYLENPGAPSPRYKTIERRVIDGRDVLYFQLPTLKQDEIHLRKDSRFTDVPYHIHSNVNLNFVYSGQCTFIIKEKPITLYEGDVAIFDLDVVRRKLTLGGNDIVINLNTSQDFFSNSFLRKSGDNNIFSDFILHVLSTSSAVHDHYMVFRSGSVPSVGVLFRQLLAEYYSDAAYRKTMIQSYLGLIFMELLRLYDRDSGNQLVEVASLHSQNVAAMLAYIERNAATCTLSGLAAEFGYHPKYISALLKQMTGSSYKAIQTRQRLRQAAVLLLQTDLPVQEIARQVGAGNLSGFYHSFEAQYGVLPAVYRRQNARR
ncbi:MAG: AraC family transcriptional regulator [Gemmiger sp.]